MKKIEHLGIAVSDMAAAREIYTALFGAPYKEETVESEQVNTVFFQCGPNKIELLEATGPDSAIAKYIAKKGEGIHHIAFQVEDIEAEMARLRTAGFQLLNEQPKRGADNMRICFVHPRSANGVLIELCEPIKQ
ncbi:MAG: methylmalonyl-CoA epimerase [Bacteroidetes bacterium]|nr:methylmalonyl-CoA epimerase [Bacteroidota bacterium]